MSRSSKQLTSTRLAAVAALTAGTALGLGLVTTAPAVAVPVDPAVPGIVYTVPCGIPWTHVILGGPGPDDVVGTPGNDLIVTFGGADTIDGRGGRDSIYAGAGDDVVVGGPGDDCIIGGDDHDTTWRFSLFDNGTDTDQSVEARYEY